MSDIEKQIEKYLSEVKNNLVCDKKLKRDIVEEIRSSIFEYAEREGIRDISEVYDHFATPEEMAKTYLSQVEPQKIRKAVNIKKAIVVGVVVLLVMVAFALVFELIDAHNTHNGHYTDTIVNQTYSKITPYIIHYLGEIS